MGTPGAPLHQRPALFRELVGKIEGLSRLHASMLSRVDRLPYKKAGVFGAGRQRGEKWAPRLGSGSDRWSLELQTMSFWRESNLGGTGGSRGPFFDNHPSFQEPDPVFAGNKGLQSDSWKDWDVL